MLIKNGPIICYYYDKQKYVFSYKEARIQGKVRRRSNCSLFGSLTVFTGADPALKKGCGQSHPTSAKCYE